MDVFVVGKNKTSVSFILTMTTWIRPLWRRLFPSADFASFLNCESRACVCPSIGLQTARLVLVLSATNGDYNRDSPRRRTKRRATESRSRVLLVLLLRFLRQTQGQPFHQMCFSRRAEAVLALSSPFPSFMPFVRGEVTNTPDKRVQSMLAFC